MQCPVIRVTPILFVPVVCVTPLNCVQMGLGCPSQRQWASTVNHRICCRGAIRVRGCRVRHLA